MKGKNGGYFEISNEKSKGIVGRRRIKAVLHEIFSDTEHYQHNGISWKEEYVEKNLSSVKDMSICAAFLDSDRSTPYDHGLTDIRDNMPYFEDATVVGHFDDAEITDLEIEGEVKRVVVGSGWIDEMRYPKFVEWLIEALKNGAPKGSVEIVGRPENENRIIYEDGWKEVGRVPMIYDYSGFAIISVKPADDAAIVMELNNKSKENKEEIVMDEKILNQFIESTTSAIANVTSEINSEWEKYWARVQEKDAEIAQLKADIASKEAELAQLRADYEKAEAAKAAKDAGLVEANAKIEELEKAQKVSELNTALEKYSAEEQEIAKDEIASFRENPGTVEINSIISKICVGIVEKNKASETHEASAPDIYGSVYSSSNETVDIYG